ncbi:MAG: hypothetical protein H7326_01540 [Bdellovibrionaceae bacterium]|nr:hypothetical protein [Pseudobdellovibrionaceae bacterium]
MDVARIFKDYRENLSKRVDHELGLLLLEQWALSVLCAVFLSPDKSYVLHAFVFGGLICTLPLYFAFEKPGSTIGRHIIAIGQMSFSALFIHLMGGRPEAHIHVFVSLAILASYRDWTVLLTASLFTVADHFLRGIYFPLSIYGTAIGVENKWLVHAAWVSFETTCLFITCRRALKEMRIVADSQFQYLQSKLEAENQSQRRTQFFSVVSHEIRTPLNGIIGFTDILKDSPVNEEQREYLDIIKQCSDSLLKVLNDLLDFTKMDQGQLLVDPHHYKSKEIPDYLETVFRIPCQKKNIRFVIDVGTKLPVHLYGDSHRLKQILTNLISNAVKFTDSGEITVRFDISARPGFCTWEVIDTGVGITEEYLPKIFSPFTQENSGIARSHGGTGLGLAISKKLVELMNGTIEVSSVHGKGTRFTILLPLVSDQKYESPNL